MTDILHNFAVMSASLMLATILGVSGMLTSVWYVPVQFACMLCLVALQPWTVTDEQDDFQS